MSGEERKKPDRLTIEKWAASHGVDMSRVNAMPDYERARILPLARSVAKRDEMKERGERYFNLSHAATVEAESLNGAATEHARLLESLKA